MSFISNLISELERSTAGSAQTAKEVMRLCGNVTAKRALFVGDDFDTPKIIAEATGAEVLAGYAEQNRAERALNMKINAKQVMTYELPHGSQQDGGWEFLWYNGLSEPDGVSNRLEEIKSILTSGGVAVFRTLCYLIEPSLDTRSYVERRFGRPEELDRVLREAKENGLKIRDFYIAPKTDWTRGLYEPLREAMHKLEAAREDDDEVSGIAELNKEMDMFELHSEEYSFVYYILQS
ncbi:MAG: hypothetical protein J1F04_06930 [Oscillospiraceae bacterium]|nr:hypothetical protein [Oscillospiraceae bacterium]